MSIFTNKLAPGTPRKLMQAPQALPTHTVANVHTLDNPVGEPGSYKEPVKVRLSSYIVDLSVDRSTTPLVIQAGGNLLWVAWTTNVTDVLTIQLGINNGAFPMQSGMSVIGVAFEKLIITNSPISGAVAVIGIGNDPRDPLVRFA